MSKQYKDYPLSYAHQMFLAICPRGSDNRTVKRTLTKNDAFLVNPGVDIRPLEKTFNTLVGRHESLRMRLVETGKGWKVRVFDKHPLGIQIVDIGDVSDEEFERIIFEYAEQTFILDSPVLFNLKIMHFGGRGDLIFFKISHIVCDGHSMVVLVEEFWQLLLTPMSVLPLPVTYRDYLKNHNSPTPQIRAENKKYWASQLLPALPAPKIGRMSKGLEPDVDLQLGKKQKTISVSLGKTDSSRFANFTRSQPCTPFGAALAAFSLSVMEKAKCNGIYLDVTLGSRNREIEKYVGSHVFGAPIRCESDRNTSFLDLAIRLTNNIRSGLQHLPDPNGKNLLGLHKNLIAGGGHPRQFKFIYGQRFGRLERSVYSRDLENDTYRVTKLWRYRMERIKVTNELSSFGEFRCRFDHSEENSKIIATYETSAFDEKEAKSLLQAMKGYLIEFSGSDNFSPE
jgi:hypothetical protein